MKNPDLATRIKSLRLQKGLSQEKLASDSQLSLRTVQRIETGESEPRGYTLNRLADSLGVTVEDLNVTAETPDKRIMAILNLSALSFLVFPLLGIIVPLSIWVLIKKKTGYISNTAKQILNFQVLWCILVGAAYAALFTNLPVPHPYNIGRPEFILVIMTLLYFVNFVFIIVNTVLGLNSRRSLNWPVLRFNR